MRLKALIFQRRLRHGNGTVKGAYLLIYQESPDIFRHYFSILRMASLSFTFFPDVLNLLAVQNDVPRAKAHGL